MLKTAIIGFALAMGTTVPVATAQTAPPAPQKQEDAIPAMAVPASYHFDMRGQRDPFINPVPKPVKGRDVVPDRPPGLKGVLLSEAQITGIVWSKDPEMNRAVLTAPGGKTYFAHKGESLFDAVVKEIRRDGVVFAIADNETAGKNTSREVVRKVRPTP